jgi:hypothetical protein
MVTVAPGTTDFCGSTTVPEMVPVTICAAAAPADSAVASSTAPSTLSCVVLDLDMDPPSTHIGADHEHRLRRRLRDARTLPSRDRFTKEFLALPQISQDQIRAIAGGRRIGHDFDDAFVGLLKRLSGHDQG